MAFPNEESQFKPGQTGNPNGRPRKALGILLDYGYTKEEATATLQNLIGKTLEELTDISKDKTRPALESVIAKAMVKSYSKGSLYTIDSLLDRIFGKAVENKEVKQTGELKHTVSVTIIKSDTPLANSEKDIMP